MIRLAFNRKNLKVEKLFKTVVDGGYCIGCGACAAVSGSPIRMELDEYGRFKATVELIADQSSLIGTSVQAVCPFSGEGPNEDQIGQELYGKDCEYHDEIGYNLATYAGFVNEMSFRQCGSSGGMGKWILYELFKENLIDAVIHVKQDIPTESEQMLYNYRVSNSINEIQSGSKSAYYPVEMSAVLQYIRNNPGRYAITGVPCFIKAVRLLSMHDSIFKERVHFCIGIICGHLKSTRYADMLAWQRGISLGNLTSIDFRKKLPGAKANQKGVEVIGIDDSGEITNGVGIVQEFFGTNYGHGFFKYQACDYCDDVVAEVADISIGDAWLPQYINDGRGTNAIIVRHPKVHELIERGIASGRLHMDYLTPDEIARSQKSGLKHRREGLAYRLYLKDVAGEWRPTKRVKAEFSHISRKLRKIYRFRVLLTQKSHEVFKGAIQIGSFTYFQKEMELLLKQYEKLYKPSKPSLWQRLKRRIRGKMSRFLRKFKFLFEK